MSKKIKEKHMVDDLKNEELFDVDELAKEANLSIYQVAMIKRFSGWLPGKKVTREEFNKVACELKNRSTGGKK